MINFNNHFLMMMYLTVELDIRVKQDVFSYIFTNSNYDESLVRYIPSKYMDHFVNYNYQSLSNNIDAKLLYLPMTYKLVKIKNRQPKIFYKIIDDPSDRTDEYLELDQQQLNVIIVKYFEKISQHDFYEVIKLTAMCDVSKKNPNDYNSNNANYMSIYLQKIYLYSVYNNIVIIDTVKSQSITNYVTYYLGGISNTYIPHYVIKNSKSICVGGPDINKKKISEKMSEISPKSISFEKRFDENQKKLLINNNQDIINDVINYFGDKIVNQLRTGESNIYLIKYSNGSLGNGIHLVSKDMLQYDRNRMLNVIGESIRDIVSLHAQNKPIRSELEIVMQEFIETVECEPCETHNNDTVCYCKHSNLFEQEVLGNLLKETIHEPINNNNVEGKSIKYLLNGKLENFDYQNQIYTCVIKYRQKVRLYPIYNIKKVDNKLYVSLILPEIFSVEWTLPFDYDKLSIPSSYRDKSYEPSIYRYVSNSLMGNDNDWYNFTVKTTSLKTTNKSYQCIKRYFDSSTNGINIINFLKGLLNGTTQVIADNQYYHHKLGGGLNYNIFYRYSIDVLISNSGQLYVVDINNAGIPINQDICLFIFDTLFKKQENECGNQNDFKYANFITKNIDNSKFIYKEYQKILSDKHTFGYIHYKDGYQPIERNNDNINDSFTKNAITYNDPSNINYPNLFTIYQLSTQRDFGSKIINNKTKRFKDTNKYKYLKYKRKYLSLINQQKI